jgi:hypothetical protein
LEFIGVAVPPILTSDTRERLHERLDALDGVIHAIVDDERSTIFLLCEPKAETGPLEPAVREILLGEGIAPGAMAIEIMIQPGRGQRRRVRFESVERIPVAPGVVTIRATLEWQGRLYTGEATGETGMAIEIRTVAIATIEAVESILDSGVGLRLTGIKRMRAFDTELVITSVHRQEPPAQHYVGAVIVGPDPLRSVSASVLHALNRMMGNFLATSD